MPDRPRSIDRLPRHASLILAVVLVATSLIVARSFAPPAQPTPSLPPGASPTPAAVPPGAYAGPPVRGVFASCNPECDLMAVAEGIGIRITATDRSRDESAPTVSPDGRRVAFRCGPPAVEPGQGVESPRPQGAGGICIAAVPETGGQGGGGDEPSFVLPQTEVLLQAEGVDYGAPRWSPDGTTIAVHYRGPGDASGLALIDASTGRATELATQADEAATPAWSPDGTRLAFGCGTTATAGGTAARFCSIPVDGEEEMTAHGSVSGDCGAPTYTPDAAQLAVVCIVGDAEGGDLFHMALSEPMSRSITGSQDIAPEGVRRVALSPDGRYAYVRKGDTLWALEPATETWSRPELPEVHGDFDLLVLP